MEITKALVLETFMKHYRISEETDDRRRALRASNDTQDELSLYSKTMSEEEAKRHWLVVEYVNEILEQDFGIKVVPGRKYTPVEMEGVNAGGVVAIEWLKTNADRVPAFPDLDDWEAWKRWLETVNAWAFELVPTELATNKEWTHGFIAGFTGDVHRHAIGQPPIGGAHHG